MYLIRRTAFRAASSSASSIISQSRSINSCSPFLRRSKAQATGISPSVFRRFASDDASSPPSSADGEDSTVSSAINSATESASSYASESAQEVSESVQEAKETFVDSAGETAAGAGLAFQPRENGFGISQGGDRSFGRAPREAPRLEPTNSVYVGNLLFDITSADLEREFAPFGKILSATVATDPRGMSKGFGYITFETIEEAKAAIEAKHAIVFEGRRLVVNFQNKLRRDNMINPPSKTLFIGNLAFEMSDADLNKLFRDIRNVIDVRVAIDRRTGQPRGFAHADFVDIDSATKAMETLRDQEIYGRKLRVDFSLGNRERTSEIVANGGGSGPANF